ncbi:CDP-diacylglycerol--glycerol-3-phosphate 3-phosphatidyltransferase [Pontimonas sp.]|uniref:CDP-diacylglycerol--glycerol-3-phosphate 3-phosphatidyltransferase n=1 Tax=Pontimonas sp. TaxID=2304492 RepID=UPI002870A609|nr:CDP-diacylglycerol--glycerol-3-phosphate 3-phosphatidyltransferase [Pontimonas sp.]MDR9396959.1 CDP-diacylglycerol--glycerol-3-phosphate 3-phosphatidyltransferase [Pontimonas sp.]MDR9434883.1 CDP-diacylglycerol--glycerol-3-phosphate 3-phosphatidyltransferase [Pontimonas sp.]
MTDKTASADTGSGARGAARFRGRVLAGGDGPVSAGNLANIITVIRIGFAPLVLWWLLIDDGQWGLWRWLAAAVFVIAISTDGIDGALARRRNLVTSSGVLLDPVADKALTGAAFVGLALLAELPWWVVIVVLGRELGITVFRLLVAQNRIIPASRGGKAKTISQAVALGFWLAPTWLILGDWIFVVNDALMVVAVALTVITGLDYLIRALRGDRLTGPEGSADPAASNGPPESTTA